MRLSYKLNHFDVLLDYEKQFILVFFLVCRWRRNTSTALINSGCLLWWDGSSQFKKLHDVFAMGTYFCCSLQHQQWRSLFAQYICFGRPLYRSVLFLGHDDTSTVRMGCNGTIHSWRSSCRSVNHSIMDRPILTWSRCIYDSIVSLPCLLEYITAYPYHLVFNLIYLYFIYQLFMVDIVWIP